MIEKIGDQSLARKLMALYAERTGRGNTKISSDISIALPDVGWYVSKDDLDKWFKNRNQLGEKKYSAIFSFLKTSKFVDIVPETKAVFDIREATIQAGLHFRQFYTNPISSLDYDIEEYSGYWEVINGELLRKVMRFVVYGSFFFYFKKIPGQKFYLAHLFNVYRSNKVVMDHASGFLFFKPDKVMVFKGYDRLSRNDFVLTMRDYDRSEEDMKNDPEIFFFLRRLHLPDSIDADDQPTLYRVKSFFDKVEWSVLPKWK